MTSRKDELKHALEQILYDEQVKTLGITHSVEK